MLKKSEQKNISTNRLMILITIINRRKTEFFMDLIQHMGSNAQFIAMGEGTANEDILKARGLSGSDKAILLSVIKESVQEDILNAMDAKFKEIKNANGIAYTIPFSSVIGVQLFNFLSDNRPVF